MAGNEKFIQSIVDLLDKLIDYQSKNTNLISELNFSISQLKSEASEILLNLREKLPKTLSSEQEEVYRKIINATNKIEDNNFRISDNIKTFEENYQNIKNILDIHTISIENNNKTLDNIYSHILEAKNEQTKIENTINEIDKIILSLKSKKAWIALIIAGIATLATAISAVIGGINSITSINNKNSQTITAPHTSTPPPHTPTPTPVPVPIHP